MKPEEIDAASGRSCSAYWTFATSKTAPLAAFEKTIRYNGQIAEKAAQTRRNADAPAEDQVGND